MYKILVVEDEQYIRKGITCLTDWNELNCSISGECENGIDALEAIKKIKPDIVITDIRMPGIDGIEMLKQALTFHRFKFLILSAYGEFEYASQAISLGVTEYILKPIEPTKLEAAIRKITNQLDQENNTHKLISAVANVSLSTIETNPRKQGTKNQVKEIVNYVDEHYREELSIQFLSKQFHISRSQLTQKFREETGYSLIVYINKKRISEAIELICHTNMSFEAIGWHVGFSEYKYFSHVFHKTTGMSPREFYKAFLMEQGKQK